MLDYHFCIHASKGPFIIMNKLKSIYNTCNSLFRDSHSQPIHICFPIIANNDNVKKVFWFSTAYISLYWDFITNNYR